LNKDRKAKETTGTVESKEARGAAAKNGARRKEDIKA